MSEGKPVCDICGCASDELDPLVIPYRENPFMGLLHLPHFDGRACPSCKKAVDRSMISAAMKTIGELETAEIEEEDEARSSELDEKPDEEEPKRSSFGRLLKKLFFDDFVTK